MRGILLRDAVIGLSLTGVFGMGMIAAPSAHAEVPNDSFQFREELDRPLAVPKRNSNKISSIDAREIKFAVLTFLWALDHEQPNILAKVASPKMKRQFPNAVQLLVTMRKVHKPIVGLRSIFTKQPKISNGTVSQPVLFEDKKGAAWQAIYFLSRNEGSNSNGKFGVLGCVVKKLKGKFS